MINNILSGVISSSGAEKVFYYYRHGGSTLYPDDYVTWEAPNYSSGDRAKITINGYEYQGDWSGSSTDGASGSDEVYLYSQIEPTVWFDAQFKMEANKCTLQFCNWYEGEGEPYEVTPNGFAIEKIWIKED